MTGRTHDLAAFTALVIAFVYTQDLPTMTWATVIAALSANFIGGLFPDIDQSTSDFWDNFRLGPFISKFIVPILGGHRHFSHSIAGTTLIGYGSYYLLRYLESIILIDDNLVRIYDWSYITHPYRPPDKSRHSTVVATKTHHWISTI